MSDIPAPSVPKSDDNRLLFCQMAIENPVQDMVEAAIKAGWDEREVLASLIEIADNLMLAASADEVVESLINSIGKSKRPGR